MNTQKARNTAAGMVRDALEQLTKWERVQDLRHFDNTKEEATRLLDLAEAALSYFEHHYDFPQDTGERFNVWLYDNGWHIAGNMPLIGCGVSIHAARREYAELVKEYSTDSLLILPADLSIRDTDELCMLGGIYEIENGKGATA